MTTALILAGHGSHISPNTAGLVWQQIDVMRQNDLVDEITAAFWKEPPFFSQVIDTLEADDITIVPLFTAQGYFTRTVIPAEMGLTGAVTHRDGRIIRYARTLGEHPYPGEIIQKRVEWGLKKLNVSGDQVSVALIGHGTKRNPTSRAATEERARVLRESGIAAEVVAVYLDDTPAIPEVYSMTTRPYLIAVPYFLAAGSHTMIDVPQALGLSSGEMVRQINRRTICYTAPVGDEDDTVLTFTIIELAREAGIPLSESQLRRAGFPQRGGEMLIQAVQTAGSLRFGQLLLTPDEIRVIGNETPEVDWLTTPAEIRTRVREPQGSFRPLPTSDNLPGGWGVKIVSPAQLHAVVETVYPGAVADWSAGREGTLQVSKLETVIARQTGIFRDLAKLPAETTAETVQQVCGHCVRQPTWYNDKINDEHCIPCREACNLWLSTALEKIKPHDTDES